MQGAIVSERYVETVMDSSLCFPKIMKHHMNGLKE